MNRLRPSALKSTDLDRVLVPIDAITRPIRDVEVTVVKAGEGHHYFRPQWARTLPTPLNSVIAYVNHCLSSMRQPLGSQISALEYVSRTLGPHTASTPLVLK